MATHFHPQPVTITVFLKNLTMKPASSYYFQIYLLNKKKKKTRILRKEINLREMKWI